MKSVRPLQIPILRWPGVTYVSGCHWPDRVGPRADRLRRLDPQRPMEVSIGVGERDARGLANRLPRRGGLRQETRVLATVMKGADPSISLVSCDQNGMELVGSHCLGEPCVGGGLPRRPFNHGVPVRAYRSCAGASTFRARPGPRGDSLSLSHLDCSGGIASSTLRAFGSIAHLEHERARPFIGRALLGSGAERGNVNQASKAQRPRTALARRFRPSSSMALGHPTFMRTKPSPPGPNV